jgi:carboxyl-terminal processing protease
MTQICGKIAAAGLLGCALIGVGTSGAQQSQALNQPQTLNKDQREQISSILKTAYTEVQKNYYDPKFQGVDWDARYREYSERIGSAHSMNDGFQIVAAFLEGLKDSHTYFLPPPRMTHFDSGYRLSILADDCFITRIRPKADADSKLHVGDQVVTMNGFKVNRQDFHDIMHYFWAIAPRKSTEFLLRSPAGEERKVTVNTEVRVSPLYLNAWTDLSNMWRMSGDEYESDRARISEVGDAMIWKVPQFNLGSDDVDKATGKARKHTALILDLRGDPGGATDSLKLMVGSLFDRDIKIADRVGRGTPKAMIAKCSAHPFEGKLIVLVDEHSASAAELLARVVQLEHRGTVIGDKTAGAVMETIIHPERVDLSSGVTFAVAVTDANLLMSDGKSLEKTGVVPDEVVLPTGADLAAGRDPALARAAELAGAKLDPAEAGKMFPFEWKPL